MARYEGPEQRNCGHRTDAEDHGDQHQGEGFFVRRPHRAMHGLRPRYRVAGKQEPAQAHQCQHCGRCVDPGGLQLASCGETDYCDDSDSHKRQQRRCDGLM